MSALLVVLLLVSALFLGAGDTRHGDRPPEPPQPAEVWSAGAAGEVPPTPESVAAATAITEGAPGWGSWTLRDRLTGRTTGGPRRSELTNTESLIKVWLAGELLRAAAEDGRAEPLPWQRTQVKRMIRHSSDSVAESVYQRFGSDTSIRRLIRECDLLDTELGTPGYWARTQMSSRDAVRMLECVLLSDRILPATMRQYLLSEMRRVDRADAFGIQDAYPAGPGVRIAVKNGWTANSPTGKWNLNCTGIWGPDQRWVLAVMTRYDIGRGQQHGVEICTEVTKALFPP